MTRVLFATSARIGRDPGWTPRVDDIDVIVERAGRWRESLPQASLKVTA